MVYLIDISIGGKPLVLSILGIFVFIVGLIYFFRMKFKGYSNGSLGEKYNDTTRRTKYPEVDAFRFSGPFLNLGLLATLAVVLLAFSWTTYEEEVFIPDGALTMDDDIEVAPPRTAEPPPPPPPPPPPVIEEVPEELVEEEDEQEFVDNSVEEETVVEAPPTPPKKAAPPPPPPPPPPPEPEVEEIFQVVEEMPTFPGCESESDKNARKQCADKKMLQYIYKNIKYPAIARENGVEGMTVISFVVEKDGSVTAPKILRDIGAGCGAEALRVIKKMPKWNPGKQRGRAVRVQFNLPVKFKLQG